MALPVATLYVEELKATMRGPFSWLGAAVVLIAVGGLAAVATQDTWLDGYGIVAYGVVPLAFIPLAAGFIAGPRANRFVESVFTSPVERRDWLAAKSLVLLTLAAAYYLSLVPMLLVYAHHIGVPSLLQRFLLWTPGILTESLAVGTLIGVLFIGRSVAAPAAAGMGLLVIYGGCVPLQELLVAQGNGATRTGHLVLLSPVVLLKNALGFTLVASTMPATTTSTWVSLVILFISAATLAVWVFLRTQGVETWEATRRQRWIITSALIATGLLPVVAADTNYERAAPPPNQAPAIRGVFARAGSTLALVGSGADVPARCCGTILNRDAPLGTDEHTRRDLLLLLPTEIEAAVTDLRIQVTGENGLDIVAEPESLERAATGWVARVPVTLTPTHPWDIGGDRYPLTVTATYRAADEPQARTFNARAAIDAQVSSAWYEMALAASVLPLLCVGAAVTRWRRTR